MAISRLGGASDFFLRYALDRWGLVAEKDVAIIQIGGEAEAVLALQNKAVDAAPISEPFTTIAQREGFGVVADISRLNAPTRCTALARGKVSSVSDAMSSCVSCGRT